LGERGPTKARQLVFDLGLAPALDRADFVAAAPNRLALATVESWPNWPGPAVLLTGPEGSGKSHLAAIWAALSGAKAVRADDLAAEDVPALLARGALVVEDLPGSGLDEPALFHALNLAREQGASMLLTARRPPAAWGLHLPDLKSRLLALPSCEIGAPDDALLRLVLVKLLADRQLVPDIGVVDYLVARMERSLEAARGLVELLDRLSLERRRPLSRALAGEALASLEAGEADAPEAPF